MSSLNRKLLRDLVLWKGQIVAIAAITACGIMAFVTMQSNYDAMYDAQASYYRDFRFADLFASVTRAPNAVAARIAALPYVQRVQTRVVQDVIADIPGRQDVATLRLIGIPDGSQPALNRLFVRSGRLPSARSRDEAVVSEAFSQANHLGPGSVVRIVVNGRRQTLRIVGVALSPEYVYELRGGADIWPDSRHFGIVWMNDTALAAAFDMTDAFNNVTVSVSPGGNQAAIIERIDAILGPFGSLGAYGRADQSSDRFVSSELRELRAQAIAIPLIFLGVATFLVNAALSRLVATQREQIAILKAFGYGNATLALHYIGSAVVCVGSGSVVGVLAGLWAGFRLALIYTNFFRFPAVVFQARPGLIVLAVVISLAAGVLGALWAVRSVVRLPPAEAMRPRAPAVFKATLLERAGLAKFLPATVRMIVRTIERTPLGSLLTAIAIAFAVAILLVGRSTMDSVNRMMDVQFRHVSREDAMLTFVRPLSAAARLNVAAMPGVLEVEPFRAVFARVSNGHRSRRLAIIGLPPVPSLHRIIDRNMHEIRPPVRGLLMTQALAQILGVAPGSMVTVAVLEGRRPVVPLRVQYVADEMIGLNVYMGISELNRILHEDGTISGAYVKLDPAREAAFDAAVKATPMISGVSYRKAALDEFTRTFAESIGISVTFILGFAFVIAAGVVYNSGRVALSERTRELCTLRILGYGFGDTALMLVGEQAILTAIAIPLGFVLGHVLNRALQPMYESDYYRIQIVVSSETYLLSAGFVVLAAAVSAALLALQLRKLDLVAALKAGE